MGWVDRAKCRLSYDPFGADSPDVAGVEGVLFAAAGGGAGFAFELSMSALATEMTGTATKAQATSGCLRYAQTTAPTSAPSVTDQPSQWPRAVSLLRRARASALALITAFCCVSAMLIIRWNAPGRTRS